MTVVAVTRGGNGAVLRFDSVAEADLHPIVQYGDAILRSPKDIRQCFTLAECARLAMKIEDRRLVSEIQATDASSKWGVESVTQRLWDQLCQDAPTPPTDPAEIVRAIVADRRVTLMIGIKHRGASRMSDEAAAATAEAPAEKKHRPIPKEPKHAKTSVISFGVDKDGKEYGPENNPKKPGTATHTRFQLYKAGQTVEEAIAAGLTTADINYDADKGFIKLT